MLQGEFSVRLNFSTRIVNKFEFISSYRIYLIIIPKLCIIMFILCTCQMFAYHYLTELSELEVEEGWIVKDSGE